MQTIPIPRLPFVPDPLRRVRVPSDLTPITAVGAEAEPAAAHMTAEGVARIWRAAEQLFRVGVYPAIALCVRREGHVVLNRTLGWARLGDPTSLRSEAVVATPQTPFVIFSAAKAMTATVTHLLDDRNLLHIGDRVAEYIPEYAVNGKGAITIEHVLSHRAGVANLPAEALDLDNLSRRDHLLELMCDARPRTRPGKLLAYHAVSGGFILAEVVERVTGKSIREAMQEEILDPLGFRWGNYGVAEEDLDAVGYSYATGPPPLPPVSSVLKRALGLPPDEITRLSNDPRFLTGVVPSANVVTTADELSRFFELLRCGGELDGVRIMDARTIRRAVVERAYREFDLTLGAPMRHSAGFMLGADALSLFGPDTDAAFGHLGFTNVLGWADPDRDLSVGLITSGKPVLHPGLPLLWALTRRIGREAPRRR
ncbi:MAG: serine hydrolase domain-containing protein [Solirubrobacteraceae bacterium]